MNSKPPTSNYQLGIKANAKATFIPIFLTLVGLAPLGAAIAYYYIQKAGTYGNPAHTGRLALAFSIIITLCMLIAAYFIWDAATSWQPPIPTEAPAP